MEALRADGVIPDRLSPEGHLEKELACFDAYMHEVSGLAANTRRQRCQIVGRFLLEQFHSRPIVITATGPAAVRRFVLGDGKGWSAGTIRVIGGSIGCCLRFRSALGDSVARLLVAIPRPLAPGGIAGGALRG